MKTRSWLFPTPGSPAPDAGLAVLRILAGTFLVLLHGLGKVPPQPGFIGWLGSLGFPVPGLFAWLAMAAEFGGGILIILGLMARPAAAVLVVHMAIVVLMGHQGQTLGERELPLLFLTIFLALALTGPGRYSVDAALARRRERATSPPADRTAASGTVPPGA